MTWNYFLVYFKIFYLELVCVFVEFVWRITESAGLWEFAVDISVWFWGFLGGSESFLFSTLAELFITWVSVFEVVVFELFGISMIVEFVAGVTETFCAWEFPEEVSVLFWGFVATSELVWLWIIVELVSGWGWAIVEFDTVLFSILFIVNYY